MGAPGAHEGGPHPLQPAVHDGKLRLQTGTDVSNLKFNPPRLCFPSLPTADLRFIAMASVKIETGSR